MAERTPEAGFTLVEVIVCTALVVVACVLALALVPTLVHASESDVLRDAATALARTEIERVRAATAYYPASGATPNHAFALNAAATFVATAHVHRNLCNGGQPVTDVPMNVALAYVAASDSITVTVSYPRNACDASTLERLALTAHLAPSALVPGTTIAVPVDDPAQQ